MFKLSDFDKINLYKTAEAPVHSSWEELTCWTHITLPPTELIEYNHCILVPADSSLYLYFSYYLLAKIGVE